MCAHTLATAEKLGVAKEFISWHQKFAQKLNLWILANHQGFQKMQVRHCITMNFSLLLHVHVTVFNIMFVINYTKS